MLAALAVGCGGTVPAAVCAVGATRSCTTATSCVGTSACQGEAPAWEPCVCAGPADAGAPDGNVLPRLGAACAADADCPSGAFCLGADSQELFGGAPPEGTCVAACDAMTACARFPSATCVDVADPSGATDAGQASVGLCLESCSIGASAGAPPSKCHGRAQVACTPLATPSAASAYCRPVCTTSGECLSGVCDPARGVCVGSASLDPGFGLLCAAGSGGDAGAPQMDGGLVPSDGSDAQLGGETGAADGAQPDGFDEDGGSTGDTSGDVPDGGVPEVPAPAAARCAGLCASLSETSTVCTRRCRFGSTDECAPELGARRRGGCLFVTKGGGIGDLGYCAELCDCSSDCGAPSFVCDAFDDANLERAFARKGVCTPAELVINRAIVCAK